MFFYLMKRALTKNSKKQIYISNGLVFSLFVRMKKRLESQVKSFLIKSPQKFGEIKFCIKFALA